jgi:sulfur-oxidizing protein SoxY
MRLSRQRLTRQKVRAVVGASAPIAEKFWMQEESCQMGLTRRRLWKAATGLASVAVVAPRWANASDDEAAQVIKRLTGKAAMESPRVRLTMPRVFPNGYTVPLTLDVDSPMSETDHVRSVRVLAPQNPIIEVACFNFAPKRSAARVSTRIRLAKPQHVLAVAEMNDGTHLMTKAWVEVSTNGCA